MNQQTVQVDLNKCPDERCDCGSPFFKPRFIIKRIPGIMVAKHEDVFNPIEFLACEVCNKPHRSTKIVVPEHKTAGDA